ncbi:uncharacterized protein J4E92_004171 [Alternaria infectoria]|uniref:uncharacterized protein n=1 Tax=Alternaria infectoria TaxID=45303 RepID=UPI00222090D5|nr:uncharacterized protein J4E92_004171 [Alternaria infectoria]KAI4932271.1 hypothetical protein J4E92_004171 [Alternaria infectoria]
MRLDSGLRHPLLAIARSTAVLRSVARPKLPRNERPDSGKLDFEARVPIPFSVFPSAYRNAEGKESTSVQVEEQEAQFEQQASHGREGHEEVHESFSATVLPPPPAPQQQQQFEQQHHDTHVKEEVRIYEEERLRRPQPPPQQQQQQFQQPPQPQQFHAQQPPQHREELHIHEQTRYRQPGQPQPQPHSQHVQRTDRVEFERSHDRHFNTVHGPATDYAPSQIDVTERQIRERTRPIVAGASYSKETYTTKHDTFPSSKHVESVASHQPSEVRVESSARSTAAPPKHRKRDMGYYDNEGQYHSLRQGISHAAHKVADRIQHPIHPHRHHHSHEHSYPGAKYDDDREEVIVKEKYTSATPSIAPARPVQSGAPVERVVRVHSSPAPAPPRSTVSAAAPAHSHSITHAPAPVSASIAPVPTSVRTVRKMASTKTITIPCHHIRIGDLLILQGRPCQVIRITTSSQTGQHRYLGVDLFTKQLHEESSFISNPAPSVVVQNMLGPVFKQYRVLDIREDGRVVAMTESGDVKQGLPVLDQSGLISRLTESFDNGRGSVRILVIDDDGMEMAVDYKVVHGSRL